MRQPNTMTQFVQQRGFKIHLARRDVVITAKQDISCHWRLIVPDRGHVLRGNIQFGNASAGRANTKSHRDLAAGPVVRARMQDDVGVIPLLNMNEPAIAGFTVEARTKAVAREEVIVRFIESPPCDCLL